MVAFSQCACAHLEDVLQVGVVSREAVVGRGAAAEEQAHGVALIAEGGLHADEDVAELLAVHQQLLPVAVQIACQPQRSTRHQNAHIL